MSMTSTVPDNTAVRTALWRALHKELDGPVPVLDDDVGLQLVAPPAGWQQRGDMGPFTAPFRASIVARARCVEDVVVDGVDHGVCQYVVLGAGLDTFAQRRRDLAARLTIFEIDQPATQAWKERRLAALSLTAPHQRFVPVDFEAGDDWIARLQASGFDATKPAIVSSLGVSMYLTRDAVAQTLSALASSLAPSSTFLMSFLLPIERADPALRPGIEAAARGAAEAGTPWRSFFEPQDLLGLARSCGFKSAEHISADDLAARYFAGRNDGLRPPANAEELLLARC